MVLSTTYFLIDCIIDYYFLFLVLINIFGNSCHCVNFATKLKEEKRYETKINPMFVGCVFLDGGKCSLSSEQK